MLFNVGKYKILHIVIGNLNGLYNMEWRPLEVVKEERDLSIMITDDLKCGKHCAPPPSFASITRWRTVERAGGHWSTAWTIGNA